MLKAKLAQAGLLKKVVEAMKDLVTDTNLDCSQSGVSLQAMDSSHVALVSLLLRENGFEEYRCDRPRSLGLNLGSFAKILKCAGNDDSLTLSAAEGNDTLSFTFESPKQDRLSEFSLKLLDITGENLAIPDTEYKAVIKMPSSEFQRICRDLTILGDTVNIAVGKTGIKFAVTGDLGKGAISLKPGSSVDEKEDEAVVLTMKEPVQLSFALRYLNFFTKATALSSSVTLHMSPDVPIVVEYKIEELGWIRYYLAPKIEDDQ